jgi:hypothetical protein
MFSTSVGSATILNFMWCDQGCVSDSANWTWSELTGLSIGSGWDYAVQLDGSDRPRLALYTGYLAQDDPHNDLLQYYACADSTCSSGWQGVDPGLPSRYGLKVNLILDAQGRPHLSYVVDATATSTYGIGYSYCSANCDSAQGVWQSSLLLAPSDLDAAFKPPLQDGCTSQMWTFTEHGQDQTAIALDNQGRPHITYEAYDFQANLSNPGACSGLSGGLHLAWFAASAQSGGDGGGSAAHKVYAPLMLRNYH